MKLLAPRNNWDMTSGSSWWPLIGSIQTATGMSVGVESTLRNGPANAATRLLAETLAGLPCQVKQKTGERQSRDATDHSLWTVLHDQPNREQDSMGFFDLQVGFQVLCGNAYSEIQRDATGAIRALWPIHPSRLPVCNIRRNGTTAGSWRHIVTGQPGEIVYYVRNDDETVTPIPASDMLHVPGIAMNSNGITGRGVPEFAAEALGIAMATDAHAAAFFRNGAVSNVAIKSKKIVGKEAADRLREQWQRVFGGVKNHYKTLLLEDDMEPVPFSIDPEKSQLMLARQFNTTDVARFWRVQPHLIGDLTRSTNNNIEQQSLEFMMFTMLPWIRRWEQAMKRQLLTEAEKASYYFKFNVNGLLRGDAAARGVLYQILFNLGALSPNDIRALEDWDAIPGGDQYFVQGNNAVPLDKIGELVQSQIDAASKPEPQPATTPPAAPDPEEAANRIKTVVHDALVASGFAEGQRFEKMAESLKEFVAQEIESIPAAMAEAVKPVVEQQAALNSAIIESTAVVKHIGESVAAMPSPATAEQIASEVAAQVAEPVRSDIGEVLAIVKPLAEMATASHQSQEDRHAEIKGMLESIPSPMPASEIVAEIVPQIAQIVAKTLETAAETSKTAIEGVVAAQITSNNEVKASIEAMQPPVSAEAIGKQTGEQLREVIAAHKSAVDTAQQEELARRKLEMDLEHKVQDESVATARAAIVRVLETAIAQKVQSFADWEAKWALKAAEQPLKWTESRGSFYMRFTKQFISDMEAFAEPAAGVGITLNPEWVAETYAGSSIADLKTLDTVAADNYHDRLKEAVKHFCQSAWTKRPALLAREIIERGQKGSENATTAN